MTGKKVEKGKEGGRRSSEEERRRRREGKETDGGMQVEVRSE